MEILRAFKNNLPASSDFASVLITALEIQIITILLSFVNSQIYGGASNFIIEFSPIQTTLVYIHSIGNLIEMSYLLFLTLVKFISDKTNRQKKQIKNQTIFTFMEAKNYILFVQCTSINTRALSNEDNILKLLGLFNLVFMIGEVFILKTTQISYRFAQQNKIRRKRSMIFSWLLILPMVLALKYVSTLHYAIVLLFRALIKLYNNYQNLENETIRKLEWFYSLLEIILATLLIIDSFFSLSVFQNFLSVSIVIAFSVYGSYCLSETLNILVLRSHLSNSKYILRLKQNIQDLSNQSGPSFNQKQQDQIILQIRILVKVYLSRIEYFRSSNPQSLPSDSDHYDNWWDFANKFILDHKIFCTKVNCRCSQFDCVKQNHNRQIENKIFLEKIYDLIKKLQNQSFSQSTKLNIIENAFLMEVQRRPFITYYQLVKLYSKPLSKQQTLQVEVLLTETRERFKELFNKEKVQNLDLDVKPLFDLQQRLKNMKLKLNQMAQVYKGFYQIFASSFVHMNALKAKTRQLTKFKRQFSKELDFCLQSYDKSIELMSFSLVYFKFFDEYTDRLEKLQAKFVFLSQTFYKSKASNALLSKKGLQIFDPSYGAVKIDLVFNLGKIISISKNLCYSLGYTHAQTEGHKINRLMPHMFARYHDRFLKNFVEKGSVKMLKHKENVYYSRNAKKFIFPISVRLKVDYENFDNLSALAFVRPTPTKSQFIIMNNYGKIEEMTEGIFKRLFGKAKIDDVFKVKKICMTKMMLSLNYYLKNAKQNDETVLEGLIITSESEQVLMDYYNLPELSISFKKEGASSSTLGATNRSNNSSIEQSTSSSSDSRKVSLDFSEDMNQYSLDMKESLKDYIKKLDPSQVQGLRVSFKFQDYVTNEFKCKILQIISIKEEISKNKIHTAIANDITDVAEFFGLQQHEYQKFRHMRDDNVNLKDSDSISQENQIQAIQELQQGKSEGSINVEKKVVVRSFVKGGNSQGSSVSSTKQIEKKKQSVILAFDYPVVVSQTLQYVLGLLIIFMAAILITVSVFSIALKGNYVSMQKDNLIISNFRINLFLELGIVQMNRLYESINMQPPDFLKERKIIANQRMKQYLVKSTTWIDASSQDYANNITFTYADEKYGRDMSVLSILNLVYSIFVSAVQNGQYVAENYVAIFDKLLSITNKGELLIIDKSVQYRSQIHYIVAFFSVLIVSIFIVGFQLKKLSITKEDKVIDFLPFFKILAAQKKAKFFDRFIQFNRDFEQINVQLIDQICSQAAVTQKVLPIQNSKDKQKKSSFDKKSGYENQATKLIRIVKDEKVGISGKTKLVGVLTFFMCMFVIFFSEYFFSQVHSKFEAYIRLKGSAFLVQLVPSRAVLAYFININQILRGEPLSVIPESYKVNVHDKIFELPVALSSYQFNGMEMEKIITEHFSRDICNLVKCKYTEDQSTIVYNQQLLYLTYRYKNAFDYMRKIMKSLDSLDDPKRIIMNWIDRNNVLQILTSTDLVLDLMKKNEQQVSDLFTAQIESIGQILLGLSLSLIPILVFMLLLGRKQFMDYITSKLNGTEDVYKHIGWDMLMENTYAVNYFEDKLKNSKRF